MKKLIVCLASLFASGLCAFAGEGDIFGRWVTIDDSTGKEKSVVEIFEREGKAYGKVVEILTENKDAVAKIPGSPKVLGLEIIKDLVKKGDAWEGGTVLDPESGKSYKAKLWVESGKLKMRGSFGPFFRTQTWRKCDMKGETK